MRRTLLLAVALVMIGSMAALGACPPLRTIEGASGTFFGHSVAIIGDLNGDHIDDYLIGAPNGFGIPANQSEAGKAFVYLGSSTAGAPYREMTDPYQDYIGQVVPNGRFGASVARLGDVDGDNVPDFAVGAPNWRQTNFPSQIVGRVIVYSGGTGNVLNFPVILSTDDFRVGTSISGIGDINNDGRTDILVGAPKDRDLDGKVGHVLAYSYMLVGGQNQWVLVYDNASSAGSYELYGLRVAGIGDVDGDQIGDYLVAGEDAPLSGVVYVRSGANGNEIRHHNGAMPGDHLGRAISGLGDVDEDGHAEYLIAESGRVLLKSGVDGQTMHTFTLDPEDATFGTCVASAGDRNNDGVPDIMITRQYSQTVYIFSGSPSDNFQFLESMQEAGLPDNDYGIALAGPRGTDNDGYGATLAGNPSLSKVYVYGCGFPEVSFVGSPLTGGYPLNVAFNATPSTYDITGWAWTFGDGGTATVEDPVHSYLNDGIFDVAVTVTGFNGQRTYSRDDYVTVTGYPPQADFSATPRIGVKPLEVQFTDLSLAGQHAPTSWLWNFGDGQTSTLQNPLHAYTIAGDYNVSLTVTNGDGQSVKTKTNFVTVQDVALTDWLVELENVPVCQSGSDAVVRLFLTPPAEPFDLGYLDFRIRWSPYAIDFAGMATDNTIITDCGWEYITYQILSSPQEHLRIFGWIDLVNGSTPSCFRTESHRELAKLTFVTSASSSFANDWYFINFYWPNLTSSDPCSVNVIKNREMNQVYAADQVFGEWGQVVPPGTPGFTPLPSCDGLYPKRVDFRNSYIYLTNEGMGPADRGDINLDLVPFTVADAVTFVNWFRVNNNSVFLFDPERQIAASNIDCDTLPLEMSDFTRLLSIINGTTSLQCPPPGLPKALTSIDTLRIVSTTANRGQTNKPIDIYLSSHSEVTGFQSRFYYDPATLTPVYNQTAGPNHVNFDLIGRAAGYDTTGTVMVQSPQPGELLVTFLPSQNLGSALPVGSGAIVRVYFNVSNNATYGVHPYGPQNNGYNINQLVNSQAQGWEPTIGTGGIRILFTLPNPSCPVLYTMTKDGPQFENTLLTACERSGYRDIVTDFYRVAATPEITDGRVRFQLREEETEVSFIHDLRLLTVDHADDTHIAVATDGSIFAFENEIAPVAAFDDSGNDRLAELIARDDNEFAAEGQGELIVTFAPTGKPIGGFSSGTVLKNSCPPEQPKLTQNGPQARTVKIELLDGDGNWIDLGESPARHLLRDETVLLDQTAIDQSRAVTLRLSWNDGYSADVVSLLAVAEQAPVVFNWAPARIELTMTEGKRTSLPNFASAGPVIMRKGDNLDLSFDVESLDMTGMQREYVIVAVGRYEPDYRVHANLLPTAPTLIGNYPNPFNPSTNIDLGLPIAATVRLDVINMLGQKVKTLVDGVMGAGMHTVSWDGTSESGQPVSSGVYFYRLQTDTFSETKKMVLMK